MTTPSPLALHELVVRRLVIHLDLPPGSRVDPDRPFTDLGLDSTGVHALVGDLEDELGVPVPPEAVFDHPTVRDLADHLHDLLGREADPVSVP